MNRYILIFFCLFSLSFSNITAQVTAGVIDNLAVNNNTPAETVNIAPLNLPGQLFFEAKDSLDLDRDGQCDVLFHCSTCNEIDCTGGMTNAGSLHPNIEFMTDTDKFIRQLNVGDAIDENQLWEKVDVSPLTSRFYGIGGYNDLGYWYPQPEGYAGVRVLTGQDTLYGWIKIKAFANPNGGSLVQVFQWAIEEATTSNQPADFVIAGVTSDLVPGDKTIVLDQGPVPTGSGQTGKLDSLDLDQDGKFDVAFSANVCNTFDCQSGSTLCVGLHENFTFVDGPLYTKRYDHGDTIFANANWNTTPGQYKFGLLIQSGIGFNGFQTGGEWLDHYEGYLGFRLVTPASDTLLGWIYIYTYSLNENGAHLEVLDWAIEHAPSQTPYATITAFPEKATYCHGDYVIFEANTIDAEQIVWHFWDGFTDTTAIAFRILPDSTVTVTLQTINQNGITTVTKTLEVSPLALTVYSDTITCAQPLASLSAETNIPANISWSYFTDTVPATILLVDTPGTYWAMAVDQYGCVALASAEALEDTDAPADLSIEYDENNHWLIAHSTAPAVTFTWYGGDWPATGDTVFISQSGTYTLVATALNGCTSSASISVIITSITEPFAETVRIQPNPADDYLLIENRYSTDLNFRIYDAAGSLKLTTISAATNSVLRLDITSLPGGLYWLTGYDAGGKALFFRRFVKQY